MNSADYAANVACRQNAEALAQLAGNQPQRFWEVLRDICDGKIPKPPPVAERLPALTEQEAIRFENATMPWGNHYGKPVGEVPCDYLLFLAEGDEFSQKIKRYVKSPRFAARQD